MHELSVALEVCRIAEESVAPAQPCHIVEVGVEVGDDSGYELANLEFCLESLLSNPPFGHARPAVARVGGDVLRLTYVEIDDGGTTDRSS